MLYPARDKSRNITQVTRQGDALFLYSEHGTQRIIPKNARTVRVSYTGREDFSDRKKHGVIAEENFADWSFSEEESAIVVTLPELKVKVCRETGSCTYFDAGERLLLAEREKEKPFSAQRDS